MSQHGPGEKVGPQFGVHTARLRRRGWPAKQEPQTAFCPRTPFLPPVCAESRRKAGPGPEEGLPASALCPPNLPEAGRPPRVRAGLASRGEAEATAGDPAQGQV